MSLPSELRSSLPSSIDPESVRAAVRAPGSPGSFGGETWVLDVAGRLAVLVRSSIFDPLEPITLAAESRPVELCASGELEVRRAGADAFVVRPSSFEMPALEALLAAVDGVVTLDAEPHDEVEARPEPAPASEPAPVPNFGVPVAPRRDPVTLADLDVIDPDLEAEVVEALTAGELERSLVAARELARQSSPRERDEWNDLVEVVTLMRTGKWEAAYLWTRGVRRVPVAVCDALFGRLRHELERRDQPALAWAALDRLVVDDSGPEQRQRIEQDLGRDGPALAREVAERAKRLFAPLAETDRLAQRGLAQALLDLDDLDGALTWIRRAIAAERFDFDARMLEAQILGLQAIEKDDDREFKVALQKAADDFHDRPEPLVDLADHVEYDDPAWAVELLRKAQEREFDEFVLVTLVELLETSGRHADVIREIEQALADPDSISLVEDQLREKLAAARARLAIREPKPAETSLVTPDAPQQKPAATVVVLALIILVVAAALALVT